MTEHNSGKFVVSDKLAKHLNICYVPKAIINCNFDTNKAQKYCNTKLHASSNFLIDYNWLKIAF